ncbi:PREDICTED: RNA polymerase I-specific transcription initiation factor RRN3-like [Ipomoea nil]|uniref:RNA polymerase I-specific transcription initiation factor RRN3-like n=1 Tax=Ipomoea nil TaxID=35883 RepID=UPI000900D0AF|nr:PREDICTED: RNA polymerase I-specific transcription initiation factor RRN3-like [Ipomoea nil]XP_019179738.1 PREDICTED: RNA polymerase I-specific transcription initiation factor RRN3-like [Ipomoea nil]XP_019179739.1 PREDICTED: RNA polymerase I-specific transcription initiation factor RRN3-like [Ipomoea nil]XP_019179740.1 PREDICTED: RNA polymerase I-specific transcription initiation factor RRN3-like [Ipomoea nil]
MGVQLAAEQVVMPEVENVDLSDSELLYHVRDALKSAIQGDMDNYSQLVGVINHDQHLSPEEVALLVTCLKALSGAVSCIDIVHHKSLLSSIFRMSMWNYGTDVMDALMELVVSLAASSGQYIDLCLEMLVSNFMPPYTFLQLLSQPRGQARKGQVLDRVHSTLKDIADLVPLSPLRLEKIIKDRMPNIFIKEPLIVMYVENMLKLESSPLGELVGSTMLVAIVDRLVDLDVDVSWDAILQDDFTKGIFDIELEDLEGPIDNGQQESFDFELQRDMWIDRFFGDSVSAQKLDSLMVLIFEYFISCNDSGRLCQVFDTLLQSFEKTVLTAYKSKFAQFVMFYACSLDPENCGKRFANMLIHIFESGAHLGWRMSAVAYLASYLARARFMDMPFVADCLERLVNWCYNYCKIKTGEINPNPRAHKDFYAGCQAIMYIICFRRGSIHSLFRIKSHLLRMRIEDILRHSLCPLMVCLPSIVEEFLRVAETTCLFSFPENNAPIGSGLLESEVSMAFGGNQRLDTFFPFDPCLLKKSDRFIRPNFIYWSMVRNTYDEVEDDECTSDEDEVEVCIPGNGMDIVDGGAPRSCHGDNGNLEVEFDYNLNKMSITPKNTLLQRFGGEGAGLRMPSRIRPCPDSL